MVLDAINYKLYSIITPEGIFDAIKDEYQVLKWENIYKINNLKSMLCESELINHKINKNGLLKIYFNENDKSLYIRFKSNLMFVFFDKNAPLPLKKEYFVIKNKFKIYNAKITDLRLINKINFNNKNIISIKNEYFKILSNWKGFIKVTYNITNEFNSFQEYLKYKLNITDNNSFNNRKYFLNNNECEMSWLNWNKQDDIIEYNEYVLLDDQMVLHYQQMQCLLQNIELFRPETRQKTTLGHIFEYCHRKDVCLVCRDFNQIVRFKFVVRYASIIMFFSSMKVKRL